MTDTAQLHHECEIANSSSVLISAGYCGNQDRTSFLDEFKKPASSTMENLPPCTISASPPCQGFQPSLQQPPPLPPSQPPPLPPSPSSHSDDHCDQLCRNPAWHHPHTLSLENPEAKSCATSEEDILCELFSPAPKVCNSHASTSQETSENSGSKYCLFLNEGDIFM